MKIPKQPGYYWAKWKLASEGTADYDEELLPEDNWTPVEVFMNCIDEKDPEHLLVSIIGVEKSQAIENFFWGDPIKTPK